MVIVATIDADGTTSIPKTVRTSEAQALTSGGIYFPPGYIPDASQGMIVAGIQPAPTAASGTPFAGTINIDTGAVNMPLNIRVQLQGGTGLTALGSGLLRPVELGLQRHRRCHSSTGTTSPTAPNFPITGKPFNRHNSHVHRRRQQLHGRWRREQLRALLNLGASSINTAFGLPAPAGNNTASFTHADDSAAQLHRPGRRRPGPVRRTTPRW